ncbi:uncharacterized protein LOC26529774 [Drosophila willistoni]|uniref:uncharacterized protein LOC26529774 n=1 Tax=Drosophila willistoni TaxID=7260 RepID=UPI001F0873D8|nr:uncharacterized protein LOC26529774 [Drosophila willistoni]
MTPVAERPVLRSGAAGQLVDAAAATLNATGQRYKVKDNIQTIHTKYVLDGKATIAFKKPSLNLLIKCDPIQLKGFLQTLKLGMEGKDVINLRLNTVTAMAQKSKLQTKMAINRHSDYPIKAFPRYLQSLTIDNTQLVKLSYHICSLRNLTHLDVSNNKLLKGLKGLAFASDADGASTHSPEPLWLPAVA